MTTERYLILHKVRGEPAYDIAVKVQIGDEKGWIIPTSGHRAYPGQSYKLTKMEVQFSSPEHIDGWTDLRDHYDTAAEKVDAEQRLNELKAVLGLGKKPKPALIRRF